VEETTQPKQINETEGGAMESGVNNGEVKDSKVTGGEDPTPNSDQRPTIECRCAPINEAVLG
jgi:hypothetical protein